MKSGTHSFTFSEIEHRFDACVGRTLGEIDSSDVFGRYAGENKGIAGSVVEQSVLGYPADSVQEPDIEVDGVDVELKVTGLKHIIRCEDGRYRRLVPDGLDQLQGFPRGWTDTGMTDGRRAFCMGNALVVGVPYLNGREIAFL